MSHQLTQKERMLLQDQLKYEEVCVRKYRDYAGKASDPELRNLFNEIAQIEEQHYNTIKNFLGKEPSGSSAQGTGSVTGGEVTVGLDGPETDPFRNPRTTRDQRTIGKTGNVEGTVKMLTDEDRSMARGMTEATADASMLEDMLMTEKHVASTYNTAVFEAANPAIRQALQGIQKDEQDHGEKIYRYMQKKGLYSAQ